MLDLTGALMLEIRDYLDAASITDRVRSPKPAPAPKNAAGEVTGPGDAREAGHYVPFVVIVPLDVPPDPRLPITDARYGLRCYGTDPRNAFAVYAGVVSALHGVGPRVKSSGLGIYQSFIEGGTADEDPVTSQPVITGTIHLLATTQAVA